MKSIITIPLLLTPTIRNATIPVNVNYNLNETLQWQQSENYKTLRRSNIEMAIGEIEWLQFEWNVSSSGLQNNYYRTQYTILHVHQTGTIQTINFTIQDYYEGVIYQNNNEDIYADNEFETKVIRVTGNNTSYIQNNFLNKTSQELKNYTDNDWAYLTTLVGITTGDDVLDNIVPAQDSQGFTYESQWQQINNTYPNNQYYIISNELYNNDQQNTFTNAQKLANGYVQTKLIMDWNASVTSDDYEVIDLGGLMWQILGMPFAFISTAFNLTLFSGTPYSINIADILMFLIASLIVIWIIRKFTK